MAQGNVSHSLLTNFIQSINIIPSLNHSSFLKHRTITELGDFLLKPAVHLIYFQIPTTVKPT